MTDADLSRVLVVIPTYNEIDNVEPLVQRLRAALPAADVLIVDDASPDGTGELAEKLEERDSRVHVLHRPGKQGLGVAYLAGFGWAVDHGFDVVCEIDADGSHHPEALPELLRALERADLVIGSRWVPGGKVENWSRYRELISRAANLYARVLLGMPVRDSTAGFRAFRSSTLGQIALSDVASQGYCFQMDLAWRTVRAGLRVAEVPITFTERQHGVSKMSMSVALESLVRVTGWAVRDRLLRRSTKKGGHPS